jgi:hypothetical protein
MTKKLTRQSWDFFPSIINNLYGPPKFDYCKLLEEFMQAQLENFHSTMSFKYQSYLVYLILSQNHTYFESRGINIIDEDENLKQMP